MELEIKSIADLYPASRSLRKNDHAIDALVSAINKFGFKVPLLVTANGEIIDGHLRYKAAQAMGLADVPVIVADDLSELEIKAFRISVNKLAELSRWDISMLKEELAELQRASESMLDGLGFSETELADLAPISPSDKEDEIPPTPPHPLCSYGEVWTMGRHKMVVGDSTRAEDFDLLLVNEQVNLTVTDPPYNIDYSGKAGKIKNDKMEKNVFFDFLDNYFRQVSRVSLPGAPIYVAYSEQSAIEFFGAFKKYFKYSINLVWVKNNGTNSRSDYRPAHEKILYGWKKGAAHCWYGGRKKKTVVELGPQVCVKKDDGIWLLTVNGEFFELSGENLAVKHLPSTALYFPKPVKNFLHPTMKPVALFESLIRNSSRKGDIVLDGFGGSGTTLIACEKIGRTARIMELDPKFAEVIIRRWEEYSGDIAHRADGKTIAELEEANYEA